MCRSGDFSGGSFLGGMAAATAMILLTQMVSCGIQDEAVNRQVRQDRGVTKYETPARDIHDAK